MYFANWKYFFVKLDLNLWKLREIYRAAFISKICYSAILFFRCVIFSLICEFGVSHIKLQWYQPYFGFKDWGAIPFSNISNVIPWAKTLKNVWYQISYTYTCTYDIYICSIYLSTTCTSIYIYQHIIYIYIYSVSNI